MTALPDVRIGRHRVGSGRPVFVIAEAGVNHDGDIKKARRLVDVAADAGADAVKFQSFRADRLVLSGAAKLGYQKKNTGRGTQWEMLKKLELSESAQAQLADLCRKKGILFLSSPFDEECAHFLFKRGVPAFKIPSGELTNHPLLERIAGWGKPLLLSTGMATLDEVRAAVRVIRRAGNPPLVLFHCVSVYPSLPKECNLKAMATLAKAFRVPVGFSDHSEGTAVALAAVALGACAVEKHFTLDRSLAGPDHRASLNPQELKGLIRDIRTVSEARGDGIKRPVPREEETARAVRKSLVVLKTVPRGTLLERSMLGALRPGSGLAPRWLSRVVGRRARRDIAAMTLLSREMLR
jgi:N-acetylneuraminate synthase/N,N'-diacetyllegionaminate synthase